MYKGHVVELRGIPPLTDYARGAGMAPQPSVPSWTSWSNCLSLMLHCYKPVRQYACKNTCLPCTATPALPPLPRQCGPTSHTQRGNQGQRLWGVGLLLPLLQGCRLLRDLIHPRGPQLLLYRLHGRAKQWGRQQQCVECAKPT